MWKIKSFLHILQAFFTQTHGIDDCEYTEQKGDGKKTGKPRHLPGCKALLAHSGHKNVINGSGFEYYNHGY